MTTYFISPFEPPQWLGETPVQIAPLSFRGKLRERWPNVKFTKPGASQHHLLEWEIIDEGIEGRLLGKEQCGQFVSLDGAASEISDFTLWYRTLIPAEYKLFFFSDSLDIRIELDASTNKEQLMEALRGRAGAS